MSAEQRLKELGIVLPAPLQLPPGARLPFVPVRLRGNHAYISGHGPLDANGKLAGPFGKVGTDVTPEQAYTAARLTMLAMLADLKTALGSLDRVTAWLKLLGMVNAAPGFNAMQVWSTAPRTCCSICSAPTSAPMRARPSAWPNCPGTSRSSLKRNSNSPEAPPTARRRPPTTDPLQSAA